VPAAAAAGSAAVGIRTACPARRATPRVARCNGPHAICQLCLSAAQGCTQQGVPGARTWPDHDEGRGRVCWQPEGGRQPAHAADHDAAGGQAREHRARRALVQPACAAGGAQRQRQGARGAGEGGGGGGRLRMLTRCGAHVAGTHAACVLRHRCDASAGRTRAPVGVL
jgi:hypothetical protein